MCTYNSDKLFVSCSIATFFSDVFNWILSFSYSKTDLSIMYMCGSGMILVWTPAFRTKESPNKSVEKAKLKWY